MSTWRRAVALAAVAALVHTVRADSAAPGAGAGLLTGRLFVDDRPAAGAIVSAIPYEEPFEEARRQARHGRPLDPVASATSAADGSFRLLMPPDAGRVRLLFRGSGAAPALTSGVYEATETEDLGDLTLAPSGRVAGRIVGPAGQPIAGAEVRLLASTGRFPGGDLVPLPLSTLTGADGIFKFEEAAAAGNRLSVDVDGFAPLDVSGLRAGALPRPLSLVPGASLSGVVRQTDGRNPAVGALVRFEGRAVTRWVETGAGGRFRLAQAPAGAGKVVADGGDGNLGEVQGVTAPRGEDVTVVLRPAAALVGRTVDASTGRPLGRVRVTARAGAASRVTRSGPDGSYRLAGLLARSYRVEGDEPRFVPFARDSVALRAGETRRLDLLLTLGATLAGRVVDEGGGPVAGARGRLARGGATGRAFRRELLRGGPGEAFRTAADGTFRASRLAPGSNQRLTVTHDAYEQKTIGGLSLAPGTAKTIMVVLPAGITLGGLVRDEARRPVPGAELELTPAPLSRAGRGAAGLATAFGRLDRHRAMSGPDGRFELKGLLPGEYTLLARKAGFADAVVDPLKLKESEAPAALELALGPGSTIAGTVVRPNGEGAGGFFVQPRARGAGGGPLVPPRLAELEPTGPDGAFRLDGLRAGETYDLFVLGPEGLGPRTEGVVAPADGVQIRVGGMGRISGRVLDAQTGLPVTDFQVSCSPDRSVGRGGGIVMRVGRQLTRRLGGAKDEGPIHSDDGSFTLDDVGAGTWEVIVEAHGYQPTRVSGVVVEAGLNTEGVEARAARAPLLVGRVLDARSGRPVLDAAVSTRPPGGTAGPGFSLLAGDDGSVGTDADGHFEIAGLAAGLYTVSAHHPDYADESRTVALKDGPAQADLLLTPGGLLAGSVLSEGERPVAGAEVSLSTAGQGGFARGPFGGGGQVTVADEAGRFRFEHLGAGRYSVVASLRGRFTAPVDAVLRAGESRDGLVLRLAAGSTLLGLVTGLSDELRGGVNISARGPDGFAASTRTGTDGRFEIAGAPSGAIDLRGTAGNPLTATRTATAQVLVPEGQTQVQAELAFPPGFTLSGTVTRAGQPVADAFVTASLQGTGRPSASARADSTGAYRLESLADGTYSVVATALPGGSPHRETITLAANATLDLVIPAARLGGAVVEAATRQPLADALVQLAAGDSGPFRGRGTTTDSNGRFAVEDLAAAAYTLTVRKTGFGFEKRQVSAAEQGTDDIVVELTRAEGIGLRAADGIYGVPLRGLVARVLDGQRTAVFSGSISLDSDGRGEIPSLPPGRYAVLLDTSGYAPLLLPAVDVPSPTLTVALTPGGTLEVHTAPEALAAGPLRCRMLREDGSPYPFSIFAPDGLLTLSTPVRRLANVAPGRYSLVPENGQPKPLSVGEGGTAVVNLP